MNEAALRRLARRFRAVFDFTVQVIGLLSPDGTLLEVNQTALNLGGLSNEDIAGKPIWEVYWWTISPETRARLQVAVQRAAQGELVQYEVDVRSASDTVATLDLSLKPISNEAGEVLFLVLEGHDITKRKEAERALQESEERYRSVVAALSEGVVIQDADANIVACNDSAAQILGHTADQLTRRSSYDPEWRAVREDGSPFPSEQHPPVVTLRTGTPCSNVVMGVHKPDGGLTWLSVNAQPLVRPGAARPHSVVTTFHDITLRLKARQALIQSREQLRGLATRLQSVREEERTRLSREVHDVLGQSLTGLRMDVAWLERTLDEQHPRLADRLDHMKQAIDETVQVVRRIASDLRPGVLDDLGIVAALEWEAQVFESRSGIECIFTDQTHFLELDASRSTAVFRVYQEILTNVARHANATRIHITATTDEDHFVLIVADNGRGIRQEELENVKSLGLLGMRERVGAWGGQVVFEGTQGVGTTVTVTLPLHQHQPA